MTGSQPRTDELELAREAGYVYILFQSVPTGTMLVFSNATSQGRRSKGALEGYSQGSGPYERANMEFFNLVWFIQSTPLCLWTGKGPLLVLLGSPAYHHLVRLLPLPPFFLLSQVDIYCCPLPSDHEYQATMIPEAVSLAQNRTSIT